MNPQFCSALPMRPKLVPFVVRPTAPVGFGVFDPPSPQYNINIPVVPIHLSCDATLSTATSKTRRELEQVGSPNEKWTNMIFELAAQKNGIRIGTVSSKGGMVKQGNSLEDFKKIAERNGITVCQEGSQKAGSVIIESDVSPVCITAPHQGLLTSLSSVANGDKSSWSEEPVDKQQNASEHQGSAALFEPEVEAEMNESKLTITDVCKDKATKSGISVQDISGSEGNQTEQCSSLSGDCGMVAKGGKCGLSGEDMVCEPETVPAAITSSEESVVVDATGKLECNDTILDPVHETKSGDEKTVTAETGEVEMTANYGSQISDLKESAENDRSSEMCINVTSPESISGAEDVSVATNSSLEDAQIKAFENIARQKGIKVGRVSSKTAITTDLCDGKVVEEIEAEDFKDAEDVIEQDAQIARFQEMARLNGIKVGENSARKLSNDSCPEYPCVESILTQNSSRSGCYMYTTMDSEMTQLETDPQIAKFQELAWLNGIKVATSITSSHSSLSTAYSDDSLNGLAVEESYPVIMQQHQDWKSDVFEELAKRNGIKVGKKAVPKETPAVTKASGSESIQPIFGGVFSEVSTQTEIAIVVDCHSQTCEEDCGISRRAAEVQVSATKEAFEEEYLLWKLDDNATENETELCFKDLYFDERKAREELSASLQNEKDVSANVRHNHKRVMDELKEVLATKIEECEKLKKDLKALRKQKESEIKRISRESKSKEEELHTAKSTLQVKDAALEALRVVASEQTAQIKQLEEQLEEMKSALSDAHSREDCKTCLKRNMESNEVPKATGQDGQSGDGWTVYTGKKSKSPTYKLTKHNRLEPGGIDRLCDIDVDAPPCAQWQSSGRKKSSDCEMQSCGLSDVSCSSGSEGFQESVKSRADAVVTVPDVEQEAQDKLTTQDKLIENNVDGKAPAQSHQQNADNVANTNDNAQKPLVGEGLTTKPPSHLVNPSTFPGQPCLFPTIPPEVLAKYLSSQMQMLQQIRPPGNGTLPKSSGPVRPPPGLNTEPVPEAEVLDHSSPPPPTSTGKFSSFDRLMVALQKRFPSKNRQELIVCLRKAKAGCGAAGFRGMQIPDVVQCVESMVELEQKQASEDNQTSPSAL